jgi:predicted MFS family arabinose efflux permease
VALLVLVMVTSTYQQSAIAVLSGFFLTELHLTRSQLGLMFTASSLIAAAVAPLSGRQADRSIQPILFGLCGCVLAGTLMSAVAPSYGFLLVATLVAGAAIGAANPVTNRLVWEGVPNKLRGVAIGLKQSGPPLSTFLTGLVLPGLALVVGWRIAISIGAILPISCMVASRLLLRSRSPEQRTARPNGDRTSQSRQFALWLNSIGFGIAACNAGMLAFLPLYAQEQLGLTATNAGLVAATMGLFGVLGRIGWGALAHRVGGPSMGLLLISIASVVATIAIGAASSAGPALLVFGAVVAGISTQAWHAVAWQVLVDQVGDRGVGQASGMMQTGSSLGFALGPPVMGLLIDSTGDYRYTWGAIAVINLMLVWATVRFRGIARQSQATSNT